jgi:thioredoxin reductase (NADPH)
MIVVGLCAEWCPVCRGFRPAFERLAAEWPRAHFVWLDIEDDADLVGDIEVENFPTLAVFGDGPALHFGVCQPQEAVVRRLLQALSEQGRPCAEVPEAVATLPQRLARMPA